MHELFIVGVGLFSLDPLMSGKAALAHYTVNMEITFMIPLAQNTVGKSTTISVTTVELYRLGFMAFHLMETCAVQPCAITKQLTLLRSCQISRN